VSILRINKLSNKWLDLSEISAVIIATILVLSILLGIYYLGWLQPLELVAYDQMVRLRPALAADPRLVVIGITEEDIQKLERWPLSDEVIARLLGALNSNGYLDFTPFRVENAQSNCSIPVIYTPFVGILNEKWCKREKV
jgi:hypothetical protein